MKIFLDGRWLLPDKLKAPIYEPGFLSAQGVFETMRADDKKVPFLSLHIDRLCAAAKAVKINLGYSKERLKEIINKALELNHYSPCYLRLTVWQGRRGAHLSAIAKRYLPYAEKKYLSGFKTIISNIRQDEKSILANIKSSSRLHLYLAELEAKKKNADEAILLNSKGQVAEGSRTNIFLLKNNTLFTPDEESGCLLGITRKIVLDIAQRAKIKTSEKEINTGELFGADEAFLTNSLIGIMPLTFVNNRKIGKRAFVKIGELTLYFRKKYQELIQKG